MSEAKKLNITFKKDSKLLQELLDDIKGNPNPIRDYDEDALKFNSLKENNAYRALMQNKKLCAFIEIGSQSPGSIELQVNENELIILKALKENGIIDYPELEEEKEKPDGEKTECFFIKHDKLAPLYLSCSIGFIGDYTIERIEGFTENLIHYVLC